MESIRYVIVIDDAVLNEIWMFLHTVPFDIVNFKEEESFPIYELLN